MLDFFFLLLKEKLFVSDLFFEFFWWEYFKFFGCFWCISLLIAARSWWDTDFSIPTSPLMAIWGNQMNLELKCRG